MDRPEPVSLVMPPTEIIATRSAQRTNSQWRTAGGGATILQQTAGRIVARGVRMQDNRGTQLLRLFDPLNSSLTNCLLTGNTTSAELLRYAIDYTLQEGRGGHGGAANPPPART